MDHRRRSHRRRTYNEPGHAHELTFSCYRRFRFLTAERTCSWLAEAIEQARSALDFALGAYVFMPEHAHLLVWPRQPQYEMAAICKAIKEPVGSRAMAHLKAHAPHWLPRVTRRQGPCVERLFWQSGGGFDRNIWEPRTLRAVIDSIHMNPVRRGLVERVTDWHWSSAGWFEGGEPNGLAPDRLPPEWCLS
jgi:putative transposase